ncbi:MAG: hypothetical protein U1G05_06780 [Kiritimatiellia bacterium]
MRTPRLIPVWLTLLAAARAPAVWPLAPDSPVPEDARVFDVNTPIGPIPMVFAPVGRLPDAPAGVGLRLQTFAPPALFSAPLPAGSVRCRSLAFGRAFLSCPTTPRPLLESGRRGAAPGRPRRGDSVRVRSAHTRHHSDDPGFQPGDSSFDTTSLNHASLVLPVFRAGRDGALGAQVRRVFDFRQEFRAAVRASRRDSAGASASRVDHEQQSSTLSFQNNEIVIGILADLTTRSTATLRQSVQSGMEGSFEFVQQGVIEAYSPSVAVNLAPGWSLGAAVNLNQDSPLSENQFRSRTTARFTARTTSDERLTTTRVTDGTYASAGTLTVPGTDYTPSFQMPLPGETGTVPTFSSTSTTTSRRQRILEGEYTELNRYEDVTGWNGTLGLRWAAPRKASAGVAVDLPWTADAEQRREIRTVETLRDGASGRVLSTREAASTSRRDMEMDFPLALSAGAGFRILGDWLVSADARFTQWSDFRFGDDPQARELGDTWAYGLGTEWVARPGGRELPLRAGLLWEQRPAPGGTDDYHGFTLGTGFRPGGGFLVDVAWQMLEADDLASIVPAQSGLRSDTRQHSGWLTLIWQY